MKIISLASLSLVLVAGVAAAQPPKSASSTTTTTRTPVGPVTTTKTTVPYGNGSYSSTTVSPGNGTKPAPYVGATTFDPAPNRQKSNSAPTVGVTIPY